MKTPGRSWLQAAILALPKGRQTASRIAGSLLRRAVVCNVNGTMLQLDLREAIQRGMFLGTFEPIQTEWVRECLRQGDCFVDVGANFGYFTTLASSLVGPSGQVFAFEPSPIASDVIRAAIGPGQLENVVLQNCAAGDQEGTLSLYLPSGRGLHSPSLLPSDNSYVPHNVPVQRLDTNPFLADIDVIRMIKIDVEGFEPNVISGLKGLLEARKIENIQCEFNTGWLTRNNFSPAELMEKIMAAGFRVMKQTPLTRNIGSDGRSFELQDFWFTIKN